MKENSKRSGLLGHQWRKSTLSLGAGAEGEQWSAAHVVTSVPTRTCRRTASLAELTTPAHFWRDALHGACRGLAWRKTATEGRPLPVACTGGGRDTRGETPGGRHQTDLSTEGWAVTCRRPGSCLAGAKRPHVDGSR